VGALLNLGVEAYALAPALRGVVAQQLVRAICPHCRESFEYGDGVLGDPDFARVAAPGITPSFSIGRGCDACFGSGYRGRRAIFEILTVDDAIRARIARGESALQIEEAAVAAGLLTLRQKAFKAVLEGVTTAEEVVRAVHIE
jgi:general secretion pathway protein E